MDCDETSHHPLGAAKTYEYITLQTQNYKRTINVQSRIIDCCTNGEKSGAIKKY